MVDEILSLVGINDPFSDHSECMEERHLMHIYGEVCPPVLPMDKSTGKESAFIGHQSDYCSQHLVDPDYPRCNCYSWGEELDSLVGHVLVCCGRFLLGGEERRLLIRRHALLAVESLGLRAFRTPAHF